jgi:hypothetical protein
VPRRLLEVAGVVAVLAIVAGILIVSRGRRGTASAGATGAALKTAWGAPDLQGIWTDPYQTPMQRPAKFANKETFTAEERAALDKQRASIPRRDQRVERGSERDVAGAYNAVFQSIRPTGPRTSLVVDPPDGRIPALTPEAMKRNQLEREYQLALLQPTQTCKNQEVYCAGGKYGPVSPKRNEVTPFYNTGRLNRVDNPEDRGLTERCLAGPLLAFGAYRRIVQSPSAVSILYDGWQRIIPVDGSPHLPQSIRRYFGDSRGRWEGDTLVVDVTNFSPKVNFQAARENLHVVERYRRVDAKTIEYTITIEDATTWTRPWTVKQDMIKQDDQANRVFYEPRCHEGNYALPSMLLGARAEERAFAAGKGPDPATKDTSTDFGNEGGIDALSGQ